MPFGDGTGPRGRGPGTGRELGGFGGGRGRGQGRGGGAGGRRNFSLNWSPPEKQDKLNKEQSAGNKAVIDKEECTGCGACISVCPQEAITLNEIAYINEEKCDGCRDCVEICPIQAITLQ